MSYRGVHKTPGPRSGKILNELKLKIKCKSIEIVWMLESVEGNN